MPRQLSLFDEQPTDRTPHSLFFALWPDDRAIAGVQQLVQRLRRQRVGLQKPLEPHRLHVTLWGFGGFIGQMPPRLFVQTDVTLRTLLAEPFPVVFDLIHGVQERLLLRPSSAAALEDFASLLRRTLIKGGLRQWLRGDFRPHMTVSYEAEDISELQVEPVTWTVRDFVLLESLYGLHQHILRGRWALSQQDPGRSGGLPRDVSATSRMTFWSRHRF